MTTFITFSRICRRFVSGGRRSSSRAPLIGAEAPADSWTTYHGDYTGQRHSRLSQITPDNVHQITLVWAFATGDTSQIKGTPILSNGIVYVTTPDNVWAIDARSAHQLWRYSYPANDGFHIGHRGVAIYKDSVLFTTPDAHLVALDAQHRQGEVERRHRRRQEGLLVDQCAADHPRTISWSASPAISTTCPAC